MKKKQEKEKTRMPFCPHLPKKKGNKKKLY